MKMKFKLVLIAFLSLVIFSAILFTQPTAPKGPLVRGFIAANVGGRSELGPSSPPIEDIYLPNVRVVLRDLSTNVLSDPVTTDLSGRFTARVKHPGRFQVCWSAKGLKGCEDKPFSMDRWYRNIGTIRIPIPRSRGSVALYGRVGFVDGSSPRTLEPLANINAFATISLLDSRGNAIYKVPVNNDDQYLLPLVQLGKRFQLRINEESYDHSQALELGNSTLPTQRIDFTMLNSPPQVDPLVALDDNKLRVSNAVAGATVTLNARVSDPDKDQLRLLWQVSAGALSSATDPEPKWKLPATQGNHAATLIVYDGKGGYAKSSLNVTIDRSGLIFSGTVSGSDSPALAGAEIDVNGRAALTDSSGFFRLRVQDRKRFVMTIRKTGYAFASSVYYDAVVGGRWRLTRAEVFKIDPSQTVDLRHKRSGRDCFGAPSDQLNWKEHPALALPQYQDGHGNIAPLPKDAQKLPGLPGRREYRRGECGPGVRVKIPANSLVDSSGRAPTGTIDAQISTVDLATPDQMPGNYTVIQANGQTRAMQSYGASTVEIFAGATKYNLRSGTTATLILPVDQVQLQSGGALPATIPLLSYDEARGVWREDGQAQLSTVDGVQAYVANVSHFTAYNTDLIKTDQACLAVQNQNMPANYNLEITVPQTGGAAPATILKTGVVGGTSETAILNLPRDTNIVLVPIRTTDPDPNLNNLPMGVFVVNTGAPQNPAWPTVSGGFANEPVGPPYYQETNGVPSGACSTKVVLRDLGLQFYPSTPLTGAFLHGLGSFAAVNLSDIDPAFAADANQTLRDAVTQASQDYRSQIDPRGLRPTLSCFKIANRMPIKPGETCPQHTGTGFVPQSPLTETTAVYANTVDLGFGREMHCVQDGANVACYVSNYDSLVYTGPGQGSDVTKAQKAVDGFNGLVLPDATVAMEFSQIEDDTADGTPVTKTDPDRVVKFFVFNQAGNPVNNANLDGLGQRPVPQLCMVCHGGQIPNPAGTTSTTGGVPTPVFNSRDNVKLNSKFLPFDLSSFSYAAPDSDAANPFNKLNQQTAFRNLNQMVKVAPPPDPTDPSSNVISDLYDMWYPGNAIPQQNTFVPLWNADALHQNTYTKVVARACRTCHVANAEPTLRFERPGASAGVGFEGNLGTVQLRVCKEHVMPHARRTHDLFWTSVGPNQPAQLQAYGDTINAFGWQKVGTSGVDPSLLCGQEFTQGGVPPIAPSAFTPVATVFSGNCVGCHNSGNAAPGSGFNVAGLNLQQPGTYARIVDFNSTELPSFKRIAFGTNTENTSYLWHKINNSHAGLPGAFSSPGPGVAMPQGTQGLVITDQLSAFVIRDWIRNGAPP